MKKHYLLITMLIVLTFHTTCFSQWTDIVNNNINFEFKIWDNYYGGGEPDNEGIAEPVMKTELYINDPNGNQYWTNQLCHWWECAPPCTNQGNSSWMYWAGADYSFGTHFSTMLEYYESDNPNSDGCTWYGADDQYGEGFGFLRDGQAAMPIVYPSTDIGPMHWNPHLGNGGNTWLYINEGGAFDQAMALTWRYSSGSAINGCLNFPTIYDGQTKSDINANRSVSTQSGVPLEYQNTTGNASADVWYSFTITEKSNVTISTDYPQTNFDTYIRMYDLGGAQIGYNDDGGANSTSVLNQQLCAGTYKFCVEGYSTSNGLFKVSVSAIAAPPISITGVDVNDASCIDFADGSATWTSENAIISTTYWVNGVSQSANSISGLAVGYYEVIVNDACNDADTWSFTIANSDNTPPIAVCESSLNVIVSAGNPAVITVEAVDNGSSDNCSGATATIFPSIFDTFDEGSNVVTMTVTDSNGLTDQCTCNVNVEVVVGLEDMNEVKPITIQPNPNNGNFQLDLSEYNFSSTAQMKIVDYTGRVIYQNKITNSKNIVTLADAAPGVYLLHLTDNDYNFSTRLVVE